MVDAQKELNLREIEGLIHQEVEMEFLCLIMNWRNEIYKASKDKNETQNKIIV